MWEDTFLSWSQAPGTAEQERCESTERQIKNAISASEALQKRDVRVIVHGSYRNRTNVRKESDVDIGVVCYDSFFVNLPAGMTRESVGISDATYQYAQFKGDVEEALVDYFGRASVTGGNKAFDVHATTARVDADVAPFFEHRRYHPSNHFRSGVELRPTTGGRIINWPEQHYENGVTKNGNTGKRFKATVRILKRLRNRMAYEGYSAAVPIVGLLLECLTWNVPDDDFATPSLELGMRSVLAFLFNNTMKDTECHEWREVSELKYLFRSGQKWTREQAHAFIGAAWDYIGYK